MLGAGLSVSFIISSGFVKSVGKLVMSAWNVSPFWMPCVTGALFFGPLLLFVYLLRQIPAPTPADEAMRTHRAPMDGKARWAFFKRFAFSIVVLTAIYIFLTAYRDLRDNFAADIWQALGYGDDPAIFTATEIPIAVILLAVMGSLMWIRSNYHALLINHYLILGGLVLIGLTTLLFQARLISPPLWMILIGLGLFAGYVPFNCILFERFIAHFRTVANAGFLIYIADSFGYLSSVAVLILKNVLYPDISWYRFFIGASYALSASGGILTLISILHFTRHKESENQRKP
jgi:hypothetical protein